MNYGPAQDYSVTVKNSFLHFEDPQTEQPRCLFRSNSWSASSSNHSSSSQTFPPTSEPPPNQEAPRLLHEVYDTSSNNSSSSNTSSRVNTSAGHEQQPALEADLASVGAALHDSGQCLPCRFVETAKGCRLGKQCQFCHHSNHQTDENKTHRPSKGVRHGYKKTLQEISSSDMTEHEKKEAFLSLASKGPYMRCLLKDVLLDVDLMSYEDDKRIEAEQPAETNLPQIQTPGLVAPGSIPRAQIYTPGPLNRKAPQGLPSEQKQPYKLSL